VHMIYPYCCFYGFTMSIVVIDMVWREIKA
jgi:hypothetical protein